MKSPLIPLMYFWLQTWLEIPPVRGQVELNLVPDAVDDQYIGCANKMDGVVPGLLEKEKSMSSRFSMVWETSEEKWQEVKTKLPLPTGFKDEHGRAIVAYTDNAFYRVFNDAVKSTGTSRDNYMTSFHFKAFHYYLTRALQLLRGKCDETYKMAVYRGVTDIRFQHKGSSPIRFGQFASSSIQKQRAEGFGTDTFFTIHTCFGVDIRAFSHSPEEEEVLIPVHEMFSVVPEKGSKINSYVLRSTNRTCSYFNCAYLGRNKDQTCVYNSATRGGVVFPGGMSPSLFGGSVILIHAAVLKLTDGF
nr:ecto-ADP-ribosyltransferase 5-like [Pelodiscus sinensis]|eukprot:XP_006110223.1 ecto-ADP-ribosyltransferase 5-like [Pelodiscus sinensis]